LKNDQRELDLIASTIEQKACYANPGVAAEASAKFIDETYILIPRDSLPTVNFGILDDAFNGPQLARVNNITENVYDGDTEKMKNLAFQYLAMASYVSGKKVLEEEKAHTDLRVDAWNTLHPQSMCTAKDIAPDLFKEISPKDQRAINAIVDLKIQLAEAKKKS
jgi:hypothetical protein